MPTLLTCRGFGSLSGQKKRKEKRFAQNWRIFRSNYAKRDNLNMPRIWREFSGNFLYWQNLRWQKISNRKFDLFLLFEPPLVIFFSYLLSKQNKNMNNAGGYQNGFFFLIYSWHFAISRFAIIEDITSGWDKKITLSVTFLHGLLAFPMSNLFLTYYILTLMLCSKLILFLKMD